MKRRNKETLPEGKNVKVVFGESLPDRTSNSRRPKMRSAQKSHTYSDEEKIINVRLDHIVDITLLRSLGYIDGEEENNIASFFINGQNTVPLMIKFKKEGKVIKLNGT